MTIKVVCTSCNKNLAVADSAVGKKIRCPKCKAVFVATEGDPAEAIAAAPPKKQGIKAPPPLPSEPVEDYDEEPAPKKKKKRREVEAEPFKPIEFRALVKKKTDVLKKGNYVATLDEEGMVIKVNKKESIDIPRGSPIEYQDKNLIEVEIDGEWVNMALTRTRSYNTRFAQAVVDFMRGDLAAVHADDYSIPWAMFIFVVLPWFAPVVALVFGAIPFAIAGGIAGANFSIISKEDWTPGMRITFASLLTGLLYVVAVIVLVLQLMHIITLRR